MSQTAGVKPMAIAGRVASERERCLGMTDAERCWRKTWLQDQILHKNEPMDVPEYWRERTNPIRRIYRAPLDYIFERLTPILGYSRACDYRYITGKLGIIAFGILATHYYFKYNANDWSRKGGWKVFETKPMVLPGCPGFPYESDRCEPGDYADRNFKNTPLTWEAEQERSASKNKK